MSQISARLPDKLAAALDEADTKLHRTHADVIRQVAEYYLDDFEDIFRAMEALSDPADPVVDWEAVKHESLRQHQAKRA